MATKITLFYDQVELDEAVSFIATHNSSFIGRHDFIRATILKMIHEMAFKTDLNFTGTMGFILIADRSFEGMVLDENWVSIEIYVDPALGKDYRYESVTESTMVGEVLHEEVIDEP